MTPELAAAAKALSSAFKVGQHCWQYVADVIDAPKVILSIKDEILDVQRILQPLQAFILTDTSQESKHGLLDALIRCQEILLSLEQLVEPSEIIQDDAFSTTSPSFKRKYLSFGYPMETDERNRSPTKSRHYVFGRASCRSEDETTHRPSSPQASSPTSLTSPHYRAHDEKSPLMPGQSPGKQKRMVSRTERWKWPLLDQSKADKLLRQLKTQKDQLALWLGTDNPLNLGEMRKEIQAVEATLDGESSPHVQHNATRISALAFAWLKPNIDLHEYHAEQRDKQEDETCDWIVKSELWSDWLAGGSTDPDPDANRRFVWISGLPGAGKTVLVSFLIDAVALACQSTGFSYYYCFNGRNQDETSSLLR
ncbi:Uu.00g001650.m01.CDS01 [Anthostomella pinea]|uniref:Uu.00g001650.m01.CDS01 n=1 Tax=Anthostomella pinea TaxID=933095 RepID=A0AAI8VJE1_9PEZI|nr:Uu.00g001650.m01.CDS01 [Anthostomella pinea]